MSYLLEGNLFQRGESIFEDSLGMGKSLLINLGVNDIYLLKCHRVYYFGLSPKDKVLGDFKDLRISKPMLHTDLGEAFQRID